MTSPDAHTMFSQSQPVTPSEHEHPEKQHEDEPFTSTFFASDPASTKARRAYFKILALGKLLIIIAIFCVLGTYWGSLWKVENGLHNFNGWIVDFDGGEIGQAMTQSFLNNTGLKNQISWHTVPTSDFPNGIESIPQMVVNERAWVVVAITQGATDRLNAAVANADATYNSSLAVQAYALEARNENSYAEFITPILSNIMRNATASFALKHATQLAQNSSLDLGSLMRTAPQVVADPVGYVLNNLRPFDVFVAAAVDFVGLIYLLILSFIAALINFNARTVVSQLDRRLTLRSLIMLRLLIPISSYFIISLFFSLLSLAFLVPFNREFGHAGFVIYWMLSWIAMLALGLGLEAMITILTARFIAFFLILWIIVNVAVCFYPIEILPTIFRYGYATPFYNVDRAIRTIVFRTRNQLGLNFGVLFAWILVSFITIPLFQTWARRRAVREYRAQRAEGKA